MMTAVMVRADSVRSCGKLNSMFAPWGPCAMKAFGKPCTWMPCRVRMPALQWADSLTPSRPIMSKPARGVKGVPTSKPEA